MWKVWHRNQQNARKGLIVSDLLFTATSVCIDGENDGDFLYHFSSDECEKIIALAEENILLEAQVNDVSAGGKESKKEVRKTEVATLDWNEDTEWIYERLRSALQNVALPYWPFEINGVQPLQALKYYDGGHYDEHIDLGPYDAATRKISCSMQLSPLSEYEGGELSLFANSEWNTSTKEQGAVIMFPSYILHQVKPVSSGVRWALVAWFCGETHFR